MQANHRLVLYCHQRNHQPTKTKNTDAIAAGTGAGSSVLHVLRHGSSEPRLWTWMVKETNAENPHADLGSVLAAQVVQLATLWCC